MVSPIERHLRELREALRHDPLLARRLCEEVADHLAEVAAELRSAGMTQEQAEADAVRRFGPARGFARRFDGGSFPLRAMLAAGALATALVSAWLLGVVAWVLPARDPAHIPMWLGIALSFGCYATLSIVFVVRGPRPPLLRLAVVVLSLGAIGFGGSAIFRMLTAAGAGGHFEGYLLLMGAILAGHGACALLYAGFTACVAHRVRRA